MDFSSNFIAILGVVALLLFYKQWKAKNHKIKSHSLSLPPQVAGALPIIGHLHKLRDGRKILARVLGGIADEYGPVFTIQLGMHKTVVISNHKIMKEFYTTNDKFLGSCAKTTQSKYMAYNYAALGFTPNSSYWRDIRKLIVIEVLSIPKVKLLNQVRTTEISYAIGQLFLKCMENKNNGPIKINMTEFLEQLVINNLTRIVAGQRYFEGNDDDKERPLAELTREFMRVAGSFVPSDLIPFLGWMDFLGPVQAMKKVMNGLDSIIESWVKEHESKRNDSNTKEPDFIDVLLSQAKDDSCFSNSRRIVIKGTILAVIVGGTDTTSNTMTWIIANLLNNRRALELAQEELDQKIGRERWLEESECENLVYLKAIIKETLRIYPAGPLAVPREAMEDCTFCGYHIPKGTRFLTNLWKLHRDPNVWSNPEEFKPERFLTTHANVELSGQNFELLPFGSGRRSCPGSNLAQHVIQLAIGRLLQGFNLTTPFNQPVDMTECLAITMSKETPLEVMLTPRLDPHLYQY